VPDQLGRLKNHEAICAASAAPPDDAARHTSIETSAPDRPLEISERFQLLNSDTTSERLAAPIEVLVRQLLRDQDGERTALSLPTLKNLPIL
jgi:hypothetical protein